MAENTPTQHVRLVQNCARCGDNHGDVVFHRLARPVDADGVVLTHWAPCPTSGEPILMQIVPDRPTP